MITSLTPTQTEQLSQYADHWLKVGNSTEPMDLKATEAAIRFWYEKSGVMKDASKLPVVYCESPMTAALTVTELLKAKPSIDLTQTVKYEPEMTLPKKVALKALQRCMVCQHDAGWMGWAAYMMEVLNVKIKHPEEVKMYRTLVESCGSVFLSRNVCHAVDRPEEIHLNDQHRIHNPSGPAVKYRDGFSVWAIDGVMVPRKVVMEPQNLTPGEIDDESNIEVRRIMIARYGPERYLVKGGAKKVHEDKFGILYRKTRKGDTAFQMVHLINSTPEPDGTHKTYFLRVPPTIKTAEEAVAWSFNMKPGEYQPLFES